MRTRATGLEAMAGLPSGGEGCTTPEVHLEKRCSALLGWEFCRRKGEENASRLPGRDERAFGGL